METSLRAFLTTEFTFELFINFLRTKSEFWDCFQYRHLRNNKECYIDLRTIFSYEHSSKNKFAGESRKLLFEEADARDFAVSPKEGKIIINDFEDYLNRNPQLSFDEKKEYFICHIMSERCSRMRTMFEEMRGFIRIEPCLPSDDKDFSSFPPLQITTSQSREEILLLINEMSSQNEYAEMAQYAYRRMTDIPWTPFVKAAIERNPVCVEGLKGKSLDDIHRLLSAMPDESIYSGNDRMAMPDEVWNFERGDGAEKAFVMAACLHANAPTATFTIQIDNGSATFETNGKPYSFTTAKNLKVHLKGFDSDSVVIQL